MSYLDRRHDPRRRATAIVAVGAIHAVLGFVVVTGLGGVIIKQLDTPPFEGVQIPIAPPPPDPTPVERIDPLVIPPTAPVPPLDLAPAPGPERIPFDPNAQLLPEVSVRSDPLPAIQPVPPRPTPSFVPTRARPLNGPTGWIGNDDYPARALRIEAEGTASYRLVVGSNGRVSACEITAGTGNRALDDATCRFISQRARFEAATDETGAKVVGGYSGTVTWRIPH